MNRKSELQRDLDREKERADSLVRELNRIKNALSNALDVYAPEVLQGYSERYSLDVYAALYGGRIWWLEGLVDDLEEWSNQRKSEDTETARNKRLFGPLTKDE